MVVNKTGVRGATKFPKRLQFIHASMPGKDRQQTSESSTKASLASCGDAEDHPSLFSRTAEDLQRYDAVIANPPYVRTGEIASLESDVRDYDPRGALDGGPDGLAAYRAIAIDAKCIAAPNAHVIAEIGRGQGEAVAALFAAKGFGGMRTAPDLATSGRKSSTPSSVR